MGNKPREVPCEKLIESLHKSNLQSVHGSIHDMFQPLGVSLPLIDLDQPLNSFARPADTSNLLELLEHSQGLNSASQTDALANLGETIAGKNSQNRDRHVVVPKKSWTNPAKLPSSPLWMIKNTLDQTKFSLPSLAGSGTNSPKSSMVSSIAEERSSQMVKPGWRDGKVEPVILKAEIDKTAIVKLPMVVQPDRSQITEAFTTGDSSSPRGNMVSKDTADMDAKQMDSSDCSDHNTDDRDEKNPANSQIGSGRTVSKNLVSERKRRKKLNEGLYKLRSLVPRISKMDKASIIGDAIDYVRELQKQVEDLQAGISDIESSTAASLGDVAEMSTDGRCCEQDGVKTPEVKVNQEGTTGKLEDEAEQKILELDVAIMEDQIYHLRIFCTKGPGVFVQLMQSLEALGLEVLNANLTSLQDTILNTFIAEIKDWEMKTEEVNKAIMDVASRFGLQ